MARRRGKGLHIHFNFRLREGRVVTVDALLTQRAVAQTIAEGGGAYVMVAKDNQPRLRQDIAGLLATPAHVPGAQPLRQARTVGLSLSS